MNTLALLTTLIVFLQAVRECRHALIFTRNPWVGDSLTKLVMSRGVWHYAGVMVVGIIATGTSVCHTNHVIGMVCVIVSGVSLVAWMYGITSVINRVNNRYHMSH